MDQHGSNGNDNDVDDGREQEPSRYPSKRNPNLSLKQLFSMCDTNGDGVIGLQEFLELSTKFGISVDDSHVIFVDLDHDGDGQINFDDFAFGFNDFLTPGSRRGSFQVNFVDGISAAQQLMEMERKHGAAKNAWKHFVTNIDPSSSAAESSSSPKTCDEPSLRDSIESVRKDKSQEISSKLESTLTSLISDMQCLQDEYKTLEKTFRKEREAHAAQLVALGEELDHQLVKTELKAKAEARLEAQRQMESERKKIAVEMENKLGELSMQMKTYEKVEEWLQEEESREKRTRSDSSGSSKLVETENRSLKSALAEAQMKATVLQTQLTQKRNEYLDLYQEFHSEKMAASEYKNQCDLMQNHLSVLSHANRVLSDANDCHFSNANDSTSQPSRVSLYEELNGRNSTLTSLNTTKDLIQSTARYDSGIIPQSFPLLLSSNSPDNDIDSGRETLLDEIRAEGDSSPLPSGVWSIESHSPKLVRSSLESGQKGTFSDQCNPEHGRSSCLELSQAKSSPEETVIGYGQTKHPLLQRMFKVILAGDAAVGKTSFIERACNGHFVSRLSSTIGVDFRVKNVEYNGHTVVLQLWDTAGQERFRSLTKSYFRRADGVILIYDVTNERTFVSIRHWIQNVEEGAGRKIPVVLCGNKIDLREELYRGVTCVSSVDGEKLGRQCDALFTEISPKTGHNVMETLLLLTKEMSAIEDAELRSSVQLKEDCDTPTKKSSCCGSNKDSTSTTTTK